MKNTSILGMTNLEAKAFFLKEDSYCNFDLPDYFSFEKMLSNVDVMLGGQSILNHTTGVNPKKLDDVNYVVLNNKDGAYSWRRMELIHPALYVSLVNLITEESNWDLILKRFETFKTAKINCLSIPISSSSKKVDKAEQILSWWVGIEQASIKNSLDYDYLIQTDLSDCYGAIYTHSIAWALHDKKKSKESDGKTLLGDKIDILIRAMRNGQTNGIPQGSVLMDFVAEMVLGHLDFLISQKIGSKEKFKILRYRDDYRIFVLDLSVGQNILKVISESVEDFGFKLNAFKTHISKYVISDSIKKDKLDWLLGIKADENLQKHLLLIHQHAFKHSNTGSLNRALADYHKRIINLPKIDTAEIQLSIIVDIAFNNPKTYPISSAIISKLLSTIKNKKIKTQIIQKIQKKFSKIPNTGHMEIWLQRVTYSINPGLTFNEKLCQLVVTGNADIWNSSWIGPKTIKSAINPKKIINRTKLKSIEPVIQTKEVNFFASVNYLDS